MNEQLSRLVVSKTKGYSMTAVASKRKPEIDWDRIKGELSEFTFYDYEDTENGEEGVDGAREDDRKKFAGLITTMAEFLRTGKSRFTHEGHAVVLAETNLNLVVNRRPRIALIERYRGERGGSVWVEGDVNILSEELASELDVATIMNADRAQEGLIIKKDKGPGFTLLVNADTDRAEEFEESIDYTKSITDLAKDLNAASMSFFCLAKLMQKDSVEAGLEAFLHNCRIVDFVPDQKKAATYAVRKTFQDYSRSSSTFDALRLTMAKHKAPEPGFMLIDGEPCIWHRPATVVFSIGKNKTGIMGMDEGAYFGIEIAGSYKSLDAAFKSLIPKSIRNVKGCMRQGEWFMVPVPDKQVPTIHSCLAMFRGDTEVDSAEPLDYQGVALPVEHADSARHVIETRREELRFGKDGKIYAMAPVLKHSRGEHGDLRGLKDQWYTFERNTALRSASVRGVD